MIQLLTQTATVMTIKKKRQKSVKEEQDSTRTSKSRAAEFPPNHETHQAY